MTIELDLTSDKPVAISAKFKTDARAVGLVGASGSGKTTLLNMIAGIIPSKGRAIVAGIELQNDASGVNLPSYRRRIGYVFQEGRLFPHLNVLHNLRFGQWVRGLRDADALREVTSALNLNHLLRRDVHNLSGGERQRVALARAMLCAPELLLLDEPLASVDEASKDETLSYIERIRKISPVPLIYVSHDQAEVARMTDVVFTMANGQISVKVDQ
jgi:molybdate transport system ATP-binding protein